MHKTVSQANKSFGIPRISNSNSYKSFLDTKENTIWFTILRLVIHCIFELEVNTIPAILSFF